MRDERKRREQEEKKQQARTHFGPEETEEKVREKKQLGAVKKQQFKMDLLR